MGQGVGRARRKQAIREVSITGNPLSSRVLAGEYITINERGERAYMKNGKPHRDDGPAVIYADGSTDWYLDGKLHRVDGPATEFPKGYKEWFWHDMRHRTDGPAIESERRREWFLFDLEISEDVFNAYQARPMSFLVDYADARSLMFTLPKIIEWLTPAQRLEYDLLQAKAKNPK